MWHLSTTPQMSLASHVLRLTQGFLLEPPGPPTAEPPPSQPPTAGPARHQACSPLRPSPRLHPLSEKYTPLPDRHTDTYSYRFRQRYTDMDGYIVPEEAQLPRRLPGWTGRTSGATTVQGL